MMENKPDDQLFFDFGGSDTAAGAASGLEDFAAASERAVETESAAGESGGLTAAQLRQAVLAHLVREGATGVGLRVPSRVRRFQADLAAYWSEPVRRINRITRCVMVDVYADRNLCLPECADRDGVARELAELKAQRSAMEDEIRRAEPELRETDALFEEFQSYDYTRSSNRAYQKLCRRIGALHQSLYKGTRVEQLSQAGVADYLYMAVPENLIAPEELFDGWGLWYILPDRSVREVKPAGRQDCKDVSRQHLVQNIGSAALKSVLFAQGVRLTAAGTIHFTRPPRARRK